MKTVDIKGKAYVLINERIKYFRENFKGWSMTSSIMQHEGGKILIMAHILDELGTVRATGCAQEKEGDGFINKTSYVENCETSAWGRALANMGIGIDASVASYEEVQNAINNQNKPTLTKDHNSWPKIVKHMNEGGTLHDVEKKFLITEDIKKELVG